METLEGSSEVPLDAAERVAMQRLRLQVAEQEEGLALLGRAAAYFALIPARQRDLR
jgi:hypothetical protein